jgi:hypothetical protein
MTTKPTIDSEQQRTAKTLQALHQNNRVLDKAGPNGIALVAGVWVTPIVTAAVSLHRRRPGQQSGTLLEEKSLPTKECACMEAVYYAARANLRRLLMQYPSWTRPQYAQAVGMSMGWVKKWIKRLSEAHSLQLA